MPSVQPQWRLRYEMATEGEYVARAILVTGGCGFSPSHVVELLVRQGASLVVNLDRLDYCASERNVPPDVRDAPNYRFVQGDVGDRALVGQILDEYGIDTVMHFAAQTHVDNSYDGGSTAFVRDNIVATHVLLEEVRTRGSQVRRFIHVSTDEVYGDGVHAQLECGDNAIHAQCARCEDDAQLAPTNPYAASKACGEILVQAYHRAYGVPAIVTRGNNIYGERQYPEKVIPRFIMQLLHDEACTLHGGGYTHRTFANVEDVARAFDVILRRGTVGKTYNIGGTHQVCIQTLARRLVRLIKGVPEDDAQGQLRWLVCVADRPYNDIHYVIDSTRLRELGWRPQVDFDDDATLVRLIEWYRQHGDTWWKRDDDK